MNILFAISYYDKHGNQSNLYAGVQYYCSLQFQSECSENILSAIMFEKHYELIYTHCQGLF